MVMYKAYIDGSKKESGRCGVGFVLIKDDKIIYSYKERVKNTDSNKLELISLCRLIGFLKREQIPRVDIKTDSKTLFNNLYLSKNSLKSDTFQYILSDLKRLNSKVSWIPREQNKIADRLAKQASQLPYVSEAVIIDLRIKLLDIDLLGNRQQYSKNRIRYSIKCKRKILKTCYACKERKVSHSFPRRNKSNERICSSCLNILFAIS